MTLKPEDRALIERIVPKSLRVFFTGVRVAEWTAHLLDAARSEGDVSRGGTEPVAWRWRLPGRGWVLCATKAECPERIKTGGKWVATNIEPLYAAPPPALPDDVIRLVIAARNVAFDDHPIPEALRELDQASEAFADRVLWEDEDDADRLPTTEGA